MNEDNPRMVRHPALAPPAPPQVEEQPEPEPTPEPEQEPEATVFVGGRERTVEEVVKGYEASTHEAMRLKLEREALAAERDALRREADAYRAQLTRPPEPEIPELSEDADPRELAAWVTKVAEQRARAAEERVAAIEAKFNQFLGAAQQFNAAQAEVKQMDPSFDPEKLSTYLAANPDVQQRYTKLFAADQAAALEYGWMKARGTFSPGTPETPRTVQSPSKRRAPPEQPNDASQRQKMLEEAERTGNWEKYYAWRAKGTSIRVPDQ